MVIEVITPRDRAAWLRVRSRDVTASTVGALFSCHEYLSLLELWAMKSGRLPRDDQENDAIRRGRLLEPVAVAILREDHPEWEVQHNAAENLYYRDPERRIGATPDVIVNCPRRGRGIVQIKSVEQSVFRRKWRDENGEVEAPLWIALQATMEAYLTGAAWAAVCPLVIGFGIEAPLIEVPLDDMPGVMAAITERTAEFWRMVDEGREPVVDYERDAALIDRLYSVGDPREEVDLTGDPLMPVLAAQITADKDALRAIEGRVASAEAQIKAAMGTAELAHIAGGRKITWRTHKRTDPATGRAITFRQLRLPR